MDVFDAMEQFKREHPEYEQSKEIWQAVREAMEAYERYEKFAQPRISVVIQGNSRTPTFIPCIRCGGRGYVSHESTYVGGTVTCPVCMGGGGVYR